MQMKKDINRKFTNGDIKMPNECMKSIQFH